MGRKLNHQVRGDYPRYQQILQETKVAVNSPISLQPKPNNAKWLLGQALLTCSVSSDLKLFAEKSIVTTTHYGLKIRAFDFCDEPVFRFDADGVAHRNDIDGIPLPERQVTTPHFHVFNPDGIEIAYKTEVLKDSQQATAIQNDINFGMAHFSAVGNIRCPANQFPQIVEQGQSSLFDGDDDSDPLAGVTF